jgi:DeoR family transcriptional regulator, aga operon transcriptional repressor
MIILEGIFGPGADSTRFTMASAWGEKMTLERRAKILELLDKQGQVRVADLTAMFGVSEVTVRNDLERLEKKKLLIKTRGGAIQTPRVGFDYEFNKELNQSLKEKQAIGKKAAELVKEKDTIILDSGTTTLEVARNLTQFKDLTIITNGILIAHELARYPNLKIVMLGGTLRQSSLSLVGPMAEENLKMLFCDKVFLGVNGIDTKYGMFTTHIEDASLNRLMITMAREVIVVTDSSKFLKRSFSIIGPIGSIDTLVTDTNVPKEELRHLNNAGVQTILVENA